VVGGSVRDFLLGKTSSKDHDIATSATPDELMRVFPDAVPVGKAFGVIKVPVGPGIPLLEIATFRTDLEYQDHRHPQGVLFAGPIEDAQRRDFTINALFYDPKTSRILDCTEGMEDLKRGVVRAIGDPMERFREDALRLLRAVRFTTSLGFTLDPATADAIRSRAKLIARVSGERVRDELTLMLKGANPGLGLQLLGDLGLLHYVLAEIEPLRADPIKWKRLLKLMEWLVRQNPERTMELAWAALLSELAKAGEAAPLVVTIGHRLKMSRNEIDAITGLIEAHFKFREVFQMREATLQRFIRQPRFEEMLALHRAEASASDGNLAYYEFGATRFAELKSQPAHESKLLSGEDLIQLGFKPGPRFAEILRIVEDLALERKLTSKEEALEYVVKHFVD
jgi:poly(A) polymerase